ncbi:MAG: hypothetical protein KAS32_21735 [Candidatus Peribacteraceae bacterium]|nr:hypothetical protein [Candidatus Peribacteraceae bacterium]
MDGYTYDEKLAERQIIRNINFYKDKKDIAEIQRCSFEGVNAMIDKGWNTDRISRIAKYAIQSIC